MEVVDLEYERIANFVLSWKEQERGERNEAEREAVAANNEEEVEEEEREADVEQPPPPSRPQNRGQNQMPIYQELDDFYLSEEEEDVERGDHTVEGDHSTVNLLGWQPATMLTAKQLILYNELGMHGDYRVDGFQGRYLYNDKKHLNNPVFEDDLQCGFCTFSGSKMPRNCERKINRQSWSRDNMEQAIDERIEFVKANNKVAPTAASTQGMERYKSVFSKQQEHEVADNILTMESRLFGLTLTNVRKQAYELALLTSYI
ncbi:hypothetical protein JTB14_029093 [Gonioctena quinquepunctata]|nr:hypothetical protein JTB14_029093 [Gonioctena quinquepunctata]